MWNECDCVVIWTFFGIALFLGLASPVATVELYKFASILSVALLSAPSFRIWSSSAEILSTPPVLFVEMLPKAHLTSHSRMFVSRWVITPFWLSWSLRHFLYSSSVYCYQFLKSASVRFIPFLSIIVIFHIYIYMYIYHNFFIHTSVKGVLVCFHVLAIESNAAVNVREHTSFRIIVFSRNMLRSEVAGSYGNSIFSF